MNQPYLRLVERAVFSIVEDFSGFTLGSYVIEGHRLYATIREEPLVNADGLRHHYSLHFCFGVRNELEVPISLEVNIENQPERELPFFAPIYYADHIEELSRSRQISARFDGLKSYQFDLDLKPGETLFVANGPVRVYEQIAPLFDRLAAEGGAVRRVYGRSKEGRELVCYRYALANGRQDLPEVLVLSGSHPPEGDTLGTEGIMEALCTEVGQGWLNRMNITIIPIANPDGFVHGLSGCNLSGRNVFWDFDPNDSETMPETYATWRLMQEVRPNIYFDFHAYTFQGDRKKLGPYIKPLLFYTGLTRTIASALNQRIVSRCDGHHGTGWGTFTPSTPGTRLTEAYNTITYAKFHFHMNQGIPEIKTMAQDLMTCVANTLHTFPEVTAREMRGSYERSGFLLWIRRGIFRLAWFLRMKFLPTVARPVRRVLAGKSR